MKTCLLLSILALCTACNQNGKAVSNTVTDGQSSTSVITFADTIHDFGKILSEDKPSHCFSFTNTGNDPLVIIKVSSNCGCTVASYPKDPIQPGGKSSICVEYTGTEAGKFSQDIRIQTNAVNGNQQLKIEGTRVN